MFVTVDAPQGAVFDTMPLSDLSVLSGIPLPHLSQYKSGVKQMSVDTIKKVIVAAAAGPDSVILQHGLTSFPVMGAIIKSDHEEDPSWCVSLLARGIQQAASHLASDADIEAFHNKPVHIAHPGWQALVSGAAVLSWQQFKPGMPWWVQPSALTQPWSPFDYGTSFAQVWMTTPIVLKEMNVIVGNGLMKAV